MTGMLEVGAAKQGVAPPGWQAQPVPEPWLKRPFDVLLALIGLIASAPLWVLIACAIWLEDGRPILYFQERVGRGGRGFKVWKFRSMVADAERRSGPVAATERDPRITRVGRVLRNTAADELPQLVNILKGDMSFVGPRADRPWEIEAADGVVAAQLAGQHRRGGVGCSRRPADAIGEAPRFEELIASYGKRLAVRPGLTGLAQVYASYNTPRRQKLRFDRLYIRNMSLGLDVWLILLSFWITFRGKWESRGKKL